VRPRNQRDYRIGSALKTISDEHQGVTLLTNHHDRKAQADDFVDSVSGSHGLAGAADALIVIARPRSERAGVLKLTGRDIPEAEYAVIFGGADWAIDGADLGEAARKAAQIPLTANLGENSTQIIEFVTKHPRGASEPRASLRSAASKTRSPASTWAAWPTTDDSSEPTAACTSVLRVLPLLFRQIRTTRERNTRPNRCCVPASL
jgi:hypothetical protein